MCVCVVALFGLYVTSTVQRNGNGAPGEDEVVRQPQPDLDRREKPLGGQSRHGCQPLQPPVVCARGHRRSKQPGAPCKPPASSVARLHRGTAIRRRVGTSTKRAAEGPAGTCPPCLLQLSLFGHSPAATSHTAEDILCCIHEVASCTI